MGGMGPLAGASLSASGHFWGRVWQHVCKRGRRRQKLQVMESVEGWSLTWRRRGFEEQLHHQGSLTVSLATVLRIRISQ